MEALLIIVLVVFAAGVFVATRSVGGSSAGWGEPAPPTQTQRARRVEIVEPKLVILDEAESHRVGAGSAGWAPLASIDTIQSYEQAERITGSAPTALPAGERRERRERRA